MRMFGLNKLPADVKDKIDSITWAMDEDEFRDEIIGQVWLTDNWVFDEDYSHEVGFTSRQDLIDLVRYHTKRVK